MTNEVGRAMFSKAGELGVPVGFMCMKVFLLSYYLWKSGLQLFVLLLSVCAHLWERAGKSWMLLEFQTCLFTKKKG